MTIKVPTNWAEAHEVAACPVPGCRRVAPDPPAELVLMRYPVTQLGRQRPPDLHYFSKTVPPSTLQILCFSERHSDWLKKFLCLPRKLKNKHRIYRKFSKFSIQSSTHVVIKPWIPFFSSFKCTSQVCIKHLHTQYLKLPVEKSFYRGLNPASN